MHTSICRHDNRCVLMYIREYLGYMVAPIEIFPLSSRFLSLASSDADLDDFGLGFQGFALLAVENEMVLVSGWCGCACSVSVGLPVLGIKVWYQGFGCWLLGVV